MTRRRILILGLGVSLLFNLAFVAAAVQSWWATPDPAPATEQTQCAAAGARSALYENLDLTGPQQELFKEHRGQVSGRVQDLRLHAREARERLWRMIATDAPAMADLDRQIGAVVGIQREVQEVVVEHMLWMRQQLDEAQQRKFDQYVENKMCKCPGCDGGCLGECSGGCRQEGPGGQHENPKPRGGAK